MERIPTTAGKEIVFLMTSAGRAACNERLGAWIKSRKIKRERAQKRF